MSTQFVQPGNSSAQRRIVSASAYSAHVQEAMRYNRLPSFDYTVVMTLLDAVLQGYTQERWEEVQQRMLQQMIKRTPDNKAPHADTANQYEQIVASLKDLSLWPWE
jgi:hypothetical protein